MNERIKLLALLSGFDIDTNVSFAEKTRLKCFAELIVQECAKLQHRNVIVGGGVSVYNMGRRDLAEDILKHFGVEEK